MPPLEQVGLEAIFDTKGFLAGLRIYDRGVKQANQAASDAARQSEQSAKTMSQSWEKGFMAVAKKALVAVAAFKGVQKATQFLQQATQLAARIETLGVSLAVVGRNADYSEKQIAEFEEAVKAQGITTQAARQSLLQMAQAEIEFTHAADLARVAQDAAVIANINSSESFQRLVWGIQTGQTRILRTMGITVSFQQAYDKLAASLGTTSDKLDEQQKVQARTNAVMKAGAQIAGTYEAAMGTAGKQVLSLARHIEEITRTIGEIGLGAFSTGIQEITRLLKELRKWIEENEEELEDLSASVTMLADAMVTFADLDLPVEELTEFVNKLTTLLSILAVGIETVKGWNVELGRTGEVLSKISPLFPGQEIARGMDAIIDKFTEMRKVDEDLFKTEEQLQKERNAAYAARLQAAAKAFAAEEAARAAAIAEAEAAEAERLAKLKEVQEKVAEVMTKTFQRIEDMQRAHDRKLADMADDYRVKIIRAYEKYGQAVAKALTDNQKSIEKITKKYEKQRLKAIADYGKAVAKAERQLALNIAKAQAAYALRERQTRERYDLTRIQSERRYQYERSRLVAEGDTLALEQLDERRELEQQEAKENEALRQKQAKETQRAMVEAMEAAGRETARALAEALAEQLKEMREQSREEVKEQQDTNAERLQEMADRFTEQQRLADEDYQRSLDKANRNYERQQEDLGRNLARQEDLQDLSGEEIARLLEHYYGEGGVSSRIMRGYFEDLERRAIATAATVAAAMASMASYGGPPGVPVGMGPGMQMGGVVVGPKTVHVESGIVEAMIPLTGPGARGGGNYNLSWQGGPIPISGLEGASPSDVNEFARALARSLTEKVRLRRRN